MDAAAKRTLHEQLLSMRDGDRRASETVFRALWPVCLGLARAALGHDADAHDAAQQGLMKLFAQVATFDDRRSGLGWALALVTWECRTIRRQRQRRREDVVDDAHDFVAVTVDAAASLARADDVALLVAALVRLDARDQQTLHAFLDGDAAGDPASRKRRQRAIDRLRALVFAAPPAQPPLQGDDHV